MARNGELSRQTVVRLLGPLRRKAARYRAGSTQAGDDLVMLTLRVAMAEEANRPMDITIYRWLDGIMRRHLR
jgi:hypothetical protein